MSSASFTQVTPQLFADEYGDRHLIHAAVDHWAGQSPDAIAIINASRGTTMTWKALRDASMLLAAELQRMGLRKGDYFAASLPLLNEHVILEYACFRLGVIHVPLDLRLQPAEFLRCLGLVNARAFAFPGKMMGVDFGQLGLAVRERCPFVEHFIQFAGPAECIEGAIPFASLMARADGWPLRAIPAVVHENDGAQVIFTTGSTGPPKPALLSHRGITAQNLCLGVAFGFGPGQRVLCNLPPSHVGGQSELLLTSLYMGGTAVTLEVFDAVKSLDAIEQHRVTLIGQIPALFQMEWRTAGYDRRDFSSLRAAVYGGQAVPRPFLDRMLTMAPAIGTGLGLTETSGFCTYTALSGDAGLISQNIGHAMPLYPVSIRHPMEGGVAGAEVPAGQVGHICFEGPQTFLGYAGDPAATAGTLSTSGVLYTGDMGFVDEHGLHLRGRAKWVLKPAGYQVFPGDVEDHFSQLTDKIASVGVVGHEHARWSEGIIAFVEKRPGVELSEIELRKHARSLTSYMRPLHYVLLEAGTMPLNRTAKVDIGGLRKLAGEEVRRLRERGRWDGGEGDPDQ